MTLVHAGPKWGLGSRLPLDEKVMTHYSQTDTHVASNDLLDVQMASQISGHMLKCLITVSELKAALKDGGHYGVVLDIQNYSGLRHDGTI